MTVLKFRLAARCESAGRQKNEDNYQVGDNLSDDHWGFSTDTEVELSPKGALLVVADGMGGLNAGEVASSVAVETIKKEFSSERLTENTLSSPDAVRQYIRKVIRTADHTIKRESAGDKSKKGMGSTIALAWLLGEKVYVGWCGDSRVYRFNPTDGLVRLSHDHSFVQELVDSGRLEPELAFDYPDSHIITRSLGDLRSTANPDINSFPLREGDIFLLCSDGLTGVLRDEEIEAIIRENRQDMETLRDTLWNASYEAGWDDNVTIVLCEILSGVKEAAADEPPALLPDTAPFASPKEKKKSIEWLKIIILLVLAGILLGAGVYYLLKGKIRNKTIQEQETIQKDTISSRKDSPARDLILTPADFTVPHKV
jgi:protein phosphatase